MESGGALSLHSFGWTGFGRIGTDKGRFLRFPLQREALKTEVLVQKLSFGDSRSNCVGRRKKLELKVFCSYKQSGAWEQENVNASANEALILKREAEKVVPLLSGQCIYLVGMMGSGKTTVAKILSEALDYTFFDCDRLIEQAVGATSVAQIFEEHGEEFFRDNESKVLKDLSTTRRLVVATGGGAVTRPINWKYMKKGVTVWLDVPLEALAWRIATVGTASRPLLHQESGDAYTQAFRRLSALFEERGDAYENADARVSLQHIAAKEDVNTLTPTAIAIEAVIRMKDFLTTNQCEEVQFSRDAA